MDHILSSLSDLDKRTNVYLDAKISKHNLQEIILTLTKGQILSYRLKNSWSVIDIDENSYDPDLAVENPDNFLNWRYLLDIEPSEDLTMRDYVAKVKELFFKLRDKGIRSIIVAEWTHHLENNGEFI